MNQGKSVLQLDKDGVCIGIGDRSIRPQGICEECAYFDPCYNKARNRCYYPTECGLCKSKQRKSFSRNMIEGGYICKASEEACVCFKRKAESVAANNPLSEQEAKTLFALLGKLASAYTAGAATR